MFVELLPWPITAHTNDRSAIFFTVSQSFSLSHSRARPYTCCLESHLTRTRIANTLCTHVFIVGCFVNVFFEYWNIISTVVQIWPHSFLTRIFHDKYRHFADMNREDSTLMATTMANVSLSRDDAYPTLLATMPVGTNSSAFYLNM